MATPTLDPILQYTYNHIHRRRGSTSEQDIVTLSGIENIAILIRYEYNSISDHEISIPFFYVRTENYDNVAHKVAVVVHKGLGYQ